MHDSTPTAENRIDREDVPERTRRALEQYLTVTPDTGRARGADDLVLVTSESGSEYVVDLPAGRCSCEDYEYREADCKHRQRARMATGREPIPAEAAAVCDIDPSLGQHTDASLRFAAADGGVVASDDAEILDEDDDPDGADDECSVAVDRHRATGPPGVSCPSPAAFCPARPTSPAWIPTSRRSTTRWTSTAPTAT